MAARRGSRSSVEREVCDYLREYTFRIRWRDPCAYTAEIHGALTGRFGTPRPDDADEADAQADPYPFIFVSTPQSAADCPRIFDSAQEGLDRFGKKLISIIVTLNFDEPGPLARLKRQLEELDVLVLVKSPPGPKASASEKVLPRPVPAR